MYTVIQYVSLFLCYVATTTTTNNIVVSAIQYTSGSTKVDVTTTFIDNYNSTEKCVTYMSNAPEKYDTACFTTTYTDDGTFFKCTVQLGDNQCNSCSVCETLNDEVGFRIDCDNYEPGESTYNKDPSCIMLNDTNIQRVLVDDTFDTIPFDFMMSLITDDQDMDTTTNQTDTTSHANIYPNWCFITISMVVPILVGVCMMTGIITSM